MKTTQHTVFITGATSGIGLAMAYTLLRAGNRVILGGRNPQKLAEIQAAQSQFATIQVDVSSEADIVRCAEEIKQRFPDLSILVNNAGVMNVFDFAKDNHSPEEIDYEIATNVLAPLKLTKLLLPLLQRQPEAAVVNVSSGVAYLPMPAAPVYSASKAALHSFSKSLRHTLQGSAVHVFEVLPPVVDTGMPKQLKGKGKEMNKMSPEAVAEYVLKGFARNEYEMRIGDNKALYWASRFAPSFAEKELGKM